MAWKAGASIPKQKRSEITSQRPKTYKSLGVSVLRSPAPAASRGGLNAREQSFVSASDRSATRRAVDADRARPKLHRAPLWAIGVGRAIPHANQTSNQTSGRSLVSWPRLPVFGNFPFHFPFRGEKGSAPTGKKDMPPSWVLLGGVGRHRHTSECNPPKIVRPEIRLGVGERVAWKAGASAPKKKRSEITSQRPKTCKSLSVSVLRSPAPAASRGGPGAREQRSLIATRQIFRNHTASPKTSCFHRLSLETAQ